MGRMERCAYDQEHDRVHMRDTAQDTSNDSEVLVAGNKRLEVTLQQPVVLPRPITQYCKGRVKLCGLTPWAPLAYQVTATFA